MTTLEPEKLAAIECWTADPCGALEGEPGTREYAERLVDARANYAPWMEEVLGYAACAGLDVLDVGCGQGIDLVRYARAGARVTGVDLTPRHVELARAHLAALGLAGEVVEGDAERLPFSDASFDRVSSNGVLHHTPDMRAALREVNRVLRPDGEARIILYNRHSLHYWLYQVLFRGVVRRGFLRERSLAGLLSSGVERTSIGARPLVRVYSAPEVRAALAATGFVDVRTVVHRFRWDAPYDGALRRAQRMHLGPFAGPVARLAGSYVAGWYLTGIGRKP